MKQSVTNWGAGASPFEYNRTPQQDPRLLADAVLTMTTWASVRRYVKNGKGVADLVGANEKVSKEDEWCIAGGGSG